MMRGLFIKAQPSRAVRRWTLILLALTLSALALGLLQPLSASMSPLALQEAARDAWHRWLIRQQTPRHVVESVEAPTVSVYTPQAAASEPATIQPVASDASSAGGQTAAVTAEVQTDQQIRTFVGLWAQSWSSKNLEAYYNAYADAFQPESRIALSEWKRERRQRILSKSKISVQVQDLLIVSADHQGVSVRFTQIYEADHLRSVTPKILVLNLQPDGWKIFREYTP